MSAGDVMILEDEPADKDPKDEEIEDLKAMNGRQASMIKKLQVEVNDLKDKLKTDSPKMTGRILQLESELAKETEQRRNWVEICADLKEQIKHKDHLIRLQADCLLANQTAIKVIGRLDHLADRSISDYD